MGKMLPYGRRKRGRIFRRRRRVPNVHEEHVFGGSSLFGTVNDELVDLRIEVATLVRRSIEAIKELGRIINADLNETF